MWYNDYGDRGRVHPLVAWQAWLGPVWHVTSGPGESWRVGVCQVVAGTASAGRPLPRSPLPAGQALHDAQPRLGKLGLCQHGHLFDGTYQFLIRLLAGMEKTLETSAHAEVWSSAEGLG